DVLDDAEQPRGPARDGFALAGDADPSGVAPYGTGLDLDVEGLAGPGQALHPFLDHRAAAVRAEGGHLVLVHRHADGQAGHAVDLVGEGRALSVGLDLPAADLGQPLGLGHDAVLAVELPGGLLQLLALALGFAREDALVQEADRDPGELGEQFPV